jgi:ABC-type antimicrobial peptide transport system permease subunit
MSRWSITSIIVIICFLFLLFAELGVNIYHINVPIPPEVFGWLIVISLVVLALAGIGILPLSSKKK